MIFNKDTRTLMIFAGQYLKDFMSDFYVYDIDTDKFVEISRDCSKQGGPAPGFTQRATFDSVRGELYVLTGVVVKHDMPSKKAQTESVKNSFWVYNIVKNTWFDKLLLICYVYIRIRIDTLF